MNSLRKYRTNIIYKLKNIIHKSFIGSIQKRKND